MNDVWLTAADVAHLQRVPISTVYRWASTDRWRRTTTRPVRYYALDVSKTLGRMSDVT